MRRAHTVILAGATALLVGTAAVAATAEFHHLNVRLPDGSIAQIEYAGDVAPKVTVAPAAAHRVATADPFARMDQLMASMEARHRAMMAQMAAMEDAAAQAPAVAPGEHLVADGAAAPQGGHYSMVSVSSSTDANGCTRTVEYRSDGSGKAPDVARTNSGNCAKGAADKPAPAARPAPAPAPEPAALPPLSDRV